MTQLRTILRGVKAEGTDSRANSRANKHTRSCSAKVQTSSTGKSRAKYNKPGHTEVRPCQIEPGTRLRLSHAQTHTHTPRARSQAVTERSEATHHHTGFLLSVTYIHHVRGIKGLLQTHSRDWKADTRSCLLLFPCPAVSPQLSKL